jgi:hypothetical protein
MLHALEATIEASGEIHLIEPIHLAHSCRAIVTILEEPEIPETALLSQQTLAHDWDSPEEDAAWSHLQ